MKILSLELYGFIPFSGVPIQKLKVDFTAPAQLIIGDNGSGKSSMLRELTPKPANSSFYTKGGYKKIVIEHNGHEYILTSDFSSKPGSHSFMIDGVEMNDSGNSGVQRELALKEFEYSDTIDDLSSFNMLLTKAKPADRKRILFELYPGNMSFVLDKHKQISTKIRSIRSGLKMLESMKAEVTDQMMSEDDLRELKQRREALTKKERSMSQFIRDLEREIGEMKENLPEATGRSPSELAQLMKSLVLEDVLTEEHEPNISPNNPENVKTRLDSEIGSLKASIDSKEELANNLTNQIRRYEEFEHRTVEEELTAFKREISQLEDQIKNIPYDPSVPSITGDQVDPLCNETVPAVENACDEFRSVQSDYPRARVWSERAVRKAEHRYRIWKNEEDTLKKSIEEHQNRLESLRKDLINAERLKPSIRCDIPECELRKANETRRTALKTEEKKFVDGINQYKKTLENVSKKRKKLEDNLYGAQALLTPTMNIYHILNANSESRRSWLTEGKGWPCNTLDDPYRIHNKYRIMAENSKARRDKEELEKQRDRIKEKVSSIQKSSLPASELVKDRLLECRKELKDIVKSINACKRDIELKSTVIKGLANTEKRRIEMIDAVKDYITARDREVILELIKFSSEALDRVDKERSETVRLLSDLEEKERKQSSLKSRLNETIQPQIKKEKTVLTLCEKVENELSPKDGLPHRRMVGFINTLFGVINDIVQKVWGYGLEFQQLDPGSPMDWKFPVIINDTNTVPDCSFCSKGEQEILNMGWIFGLCKLLGIGKKVPIRPDEPDGGLSDGNRGRILSLVSTMIEDGHVEQLFLVDHHYSLFGAFTQSEILCLNPENIILPKDYNTHVTFDK